MNGISFVPSPTAPARPPPAPRVDRRYAWRCCAAHLQNGTVSPGAEGRAPGWAARELQPDRTRASTHWRRREGLVVPARPALPLPGGPPLPRRVHLEGQRVAAPATGGVALGDNGYFWFVDPGPTSSWWSIADGRAINGHFGPSYGGRDPTLRNPVRSPTRLPGAVKVPTQSGRQSSRQRRRHRRLHARPPRPPSPLTPKDGCSPRLRPTKASCAGGPGSLFWRRALPGPSSPGGTSRGRPEAGRRWPALLHTGYFWFTCSVHVEVIVKCSTGGDHRPLLGLLRAACRTSSTRSR